MDQVLNQAGESVTPEPIQTDLQFLLAANEFGLKLHRHLDPHRVSLDAVNDAASLVRCDRFSIAIKSGSKLRVTHCTGQEQVARRSETVRRLEALATRAFSLNRAVVFAGDEQSVDPLIAAALSDYVESSRARMIALLPLRCETAAIRRKHDRESVEGQFRDRNGGNPFGLLIAERFSSSVIQPSMPKRCRLLADHVESALGSARQHHKIPFRRTIIWLADVIASLRGRRLLASVAAFAMFAAVLAVLVFVEAPYRVSCSGVLMPVSQQRYFAPMDAKVSEVFVRDGQSVDRGAVMIRLKSESLLALIVSTEVQIEESQKLIEALSAQLVIEQSSGADQRSIELQAEIAKAEVDLAGGEETLAVLREQEDALLIRASHPGVVNGFRLEERLLKRPVDRGDKLLEVVDPLGPWRLELEIDEYRAGPVVQQKTRSEEPLAVKYVLATQVGEDRWATLESVAAQVEKSLDGQRLVVHALADAPLENLQQEYVGAEVFAKIYSGEKPLGYVIFGDVLDFLRRTVWF
ncbi:MAG: efflux RND transporter periplasmic adaptor subunit [Planctomycetota bacterium]